METILRFNSKPVLFLAYGLAAAACAAFIVLLSHGGSDQGAQKQAGPVTLQLQAGLERQPSTIVKIYRARNFAPLWVQDDGLTEDARKTIAILAAADEDGLPAGRYKLPPPPTAKESDRAKANFDLQLTVAVLKYASDMRWGALLPARLYDDVSLPRESDDIPRRLLEAAQSGNVHETLRALEPQQPQYALLKASLKIYRGGAPWPTIAAGMSQGNLLRLQARLQAENYLPATQTGLPVRVLMAALRTYQTDNGLTADGRLTDRTLAMLNIPPMARADQIAANMERWRWLPRDLGQQYIMVNVPDASLAVVEGGSPTLLSRVVVGAPDKPTPILEARAVAVTINPAWHVPKSIVENEIQPKLDNNPDYLEEKNMISQDGDVIQQPGPDNALGVAKFEMPNPFDVYLHDTPSKHAFLSDDRALSHGCVRVEAIHQLVEKMLGIEHGKLEELVAAGQTVREPLKQPLPVYILYWTAIAGENHKTVFRQDVYGRDARLISKMFPQHATVRLANER